jgi:hypothetical protein
VQRKAFLRVLAGSVAGLAFSDPLKDVAASVTTTRIHPQAGGAEVDQVRHLARLFAEQDHRFGGGLSAQTAVTHLATAAGRLEARFAKDTVREQYFSAVAQLADTAGGMCFDAGLHSHAERCFRFAVGCSTEAGDWSMRAKALTGLANLAVHRGQPDDALSFSELALVRADRLTPIVRAVVHSRHARALGLAGAHRGHDCLAAVRQAEDHFVAGNGAAGEPSWIAYYDVAHLERDLGRALLQLGVNGGDHREARTRLTAAVAQFSSGYSRGKALAMANLAHLTMAHDDPAHAVQLGDEALQAVGSVRSDRVLDALRQLRVAGQTYNDTADVRALNQRIDETLRTAAV